MDELNRYTKNVPEMVRIDRWLMAARFFKTRSQAAQACDGGKIKVNGQVAKPSKNVRAGDGLVMHHRNRYRKIRILELAQRGLPPKLARLLYEEDETTILSEEDQQLIRIQKEAEQRIKRKYKGRPTKKERRTIDKFYRR